VERVIEEKLGPNLRAWAGRVGGMAHAHVHMDLEINFVLRGPMRYLIQGREVSLPPGRLCLLWGSIAHRTLLSDGVPELIWVTAPLELLWRMPLGRPFFDRLMKRGLLIDSRPQPQDRAMLQQWCEDLREPDERQHRVVRLELEARLQRLVMAMPAHDSGPSGGSVRPLNAASGHVRAMARHIARRLRHELTVDDIAAAAGISANHAMTLFRRHTGVTINEHLTRQRVALAQRLLATTRRPVLQVGFDCGFGSVSRFYEAFKAQTGSSPAAFRRQHRRARVS
jgi:AraC-like DNA-binding protein